MDLIEKVARKLAEFYSEDWDAKDFTETMSGNSPEEMREGFMAMATVVIETVRKHDATND